MPDPMRVLVIGGNGQTGFQVVQRLHEQSRHEPLAMIREPAQRARFDALGVPTVLGDLAYPIDHAVRGCDAVIFAAGSGPKTGKDQTILIDDLGAVRAMVAAQVNGARRFVLLSSLNADPASESRIKHYHRAKGRADRTLAELDQLLDGEPLRWTSIHPGGLFVSHRSASLPPEHPIPTRREVHRGRAGDGDEVGEVGIPARAIDQGGEGAEVHSQREQVAAHEGGERARRMRAVVAEGPGLVEQVAVAGRHDPGQGRGEGVVQAEEDE